MKSLTVFKIVSIKHERQAIVDGSAHPSDSNPATALSTSELISQTNHPFISRPRLAIKRWLAKPKQIARKQNERGKAVAPSLDIRGIQINTERKAPAVFSDVVLIINPITRN